MLDNLTAINVKTINGGSKRVRLADCAAYPLSEWGKKVSAAAVIEDRLQRNFGLSFNVDRLFVAGSDFWFAGSSDLGFFEVPQHLGSGWRFAFSQRPNHDETHQYRRDPATGARDKFIYDESCKGTPWPMIQAKVNAKSEWDAIYSRQGIDSAAKRYAKRLGLPAPPPPNRSPRK
jgi:hypothetical protein